MNTWATTIISGLVLIVAFMQWRTAHQKVLLDLFDRRMNIYDQVTEMQRRAMRLGDQLTGVEIDHIRDVRNRARFLFGDEVSDALKKWHDVLIDLTISADILRAGNGSRLDHNPKIASALRQLLPYRDSLPVLFVPYLKMDQKRHGSLIPWLKDRNRARLSYADEKQK
ncbi:hypothetical protein C241_19427 [Bradyrhizobium lupini HPC(L)]|uniref:LemA family protein n=1 Tax=Bradyrhizobium lupini HPC(L) TaxID=1229491 RepID=A0ABP2RMY3_RHILU|nr:hypothetical protein C241_19427 [Bradyrhizobium lupini HPC(L)]